MISPQCSHLTQRPNGTLTLLPSAASPLGKMSFLNQIIVPRARRPARGALAGRAVNFAFFECLHECVDYLYVKLPASAFFYLTPGVFRRQAFPVPPAAALGVVGVAYREDAGRKRDSRVLEPRRVAEPVHPLVVMEHP